MSANDNHQPLPPFPPGSPRRGEVWHHIRTGRPYQIVTLAYDEATLDHCVIYQTHWGEGFAWSRPLAEFAQKFEFRGNVPLSPA